MRSASLGLYNSHAYALVGAYELKDKSGNVVYRLVRIMNPHGSDGSYNGAWNDKDKRWTPEFKAQAPYADKDDGLTYMNIEDFVETWDSSYINNAHDDWVTSTHSVTNDKGSTLVIFENPIQQEVFVQIDFWPLRMFPYGCKNKETNGLMSVIDSNGNTLANTVH